MAAKAPLVSPAFSGTPTAPTAAADTNTTQLATTAYVVGQGYLKSSSASSTYAPLASPNFSGAPTAPTAALGTDNTQIATTAFVQAEIANDAPTKTGSGASGTWGINISGNAATVTNGVYTTSSVLVARGSAGNPADWNTITTAGVYTIASGTTLNGSNSPGGYAYGTLIVTTDGERTTQIYVRHNSINETSIRNKWNASDWQPWATLISGSTGSSTSGQVLTANGTGALATWATPTVPDGSITTAKLASTAVTKIPQNSQSTGYTLVASDTGKHIDITTGGVTVPSGVFSVGDAITIYNDSASSQTITQGGSVTLRQAGTANTGNRTLAQYGIATVLCVASNTFVITGAGLS